MLRTLCLADGSTLDHALILFFEGPQSATGEDCAELHLHGGRAVVARALDVLAAMPGLRQAEAGEFTKRAFLNGQLNLVEAESLGDLVSAETEAQRRFAIENSGAKQTALYDSWRQRLLHARAMIEAELDFADEGDVPGSVADAVWRDIGELRAEIAGHIEGFRRAEVVRDGYRVVLAGPPNAGKSSLLNALARRDVAIVADEPGTTRDVIDVVLDINGYRIVLSDTAGLRDDAIGIEAMGIERTRATMDRAHMILAIRPWSEGDATAMHRETVDVMSKIDLAPDGFAPKGLLAISTKTGVGLEELLEVIAKRAALAADWGQDVLPARERHVELLKRGVLEIEGALDPETPLELRAEALRLAGDSIGRVIGRVDVEDLLAEIFSKFCIGK